MKWMHEQSAYFKKKKIPRVFSLFLFSTKKIIGQQANQRERFYGTAAMVVTIGKPNLTIR